MKFIILGESRSGTTTIRDTINQHPQVMMVGETFHNNRYKYLGKELTNEEYCDLFFDNYSNRDLVKQSFGLNRPEAWRQILSQDKIKNIKKTSDYALGLTLFRDGLKDPKDLSFLKKYNLKIIYIERRSKRDAAISREVAEQTRIFHDFHKENDDDVFEITIDEGRLKRCTERREEHHKECMNFLKNYNQDYMHLIFEDGLFSNKTIKKIFHFLEVDDISVELKGKKLNLNLRHTAK